MPFQELGFFGGKTVLRKQFGQVVDDGSKKSIKTSGASAWNERKVACRNPYCRVHGYGHQRERAKETQVSGTESSGDQYKSHVSNAYGVTEDLIMDGDEANMSVPIKKSKVLSEHAPGAVSTETRVMLKPRRQPSQQNRYICTLHIVYFRASIRCFIIGTSGALSPSWQI